MCNAPGKKVEPSCLSCSKKISLYNKFMNVEVQLMDVRY